MLLSFNLCLDHGIVWAFDASGAAKGWLGSFACAMGLAPGEGRADRRIHFEVMPRRHGEFFGPRLLVSARGLTAGKWKLREFPDMVFFEHPAIREVICEIASGADGPGQVHQMRRAMLPVYIDTLLSGGMPVHGALVEIDGSGIILAGRSGTGKSTACRRLPPSWRVLADDLCLVVRDPSGSYRVHPLPTWSAIRENGGPGLCQSGASVPLRAVFFLEQYPRDECVGLKKSAAAVSMAASAVEVFRSIDFGFPRKEEKEVKKALYANAASLALAVPGFILRISLTGLFGEKIEEMLENGGAVRPLETGSIEGRISGSVMVRAGGGY